MQLSTEKILVPVNIEYVTAYMRNHKMNLNGLATKLKCNANDLREWIGAKELPLDIVAKMRKLLGQTGKHNTFAHMTDYLDRLALTI